MTTESTYLAVFTGSKTSDRRSAWDALSESERAARQRAGMTAWKEWMSHHQASIVAIGGPLGKTRQVTERGVADISNQLAAFTIVRASSHEAAAQMFERHPHFAIFPGDAVEVMPILPVPGG